MNLCIDLKKDLHEFRIKRDCQNTSENRKGKLGVLEGFVIKSGLIEPLST